MSALVPMHNPPNTLTLRVNHIMFRSEARAQSAKQVSFQTIYLAAPHVHTRIGEATADCMLNSLGNDLATGGHDVQLRASTAERPAASHRQNLVSVHGVALDDVIGRPPAHPKAATIKPSKVLRNEILSSIWSRLHHKAPHAGDCRSRDVHCVAELEATGHVAVPHGLGLLDQDCGPRHMLLHPVHTAGCRLLRVPAHTFHAIQKSPPAMLVEGILRLHLRLTQLI
mmetsp:Transcript_62556/g.158036  ORF Transcript_62556/g.158036 Transcript_62556/m.158036 type:complete len:226 (+) Transcript_62556:537-1214(+)